MKKNSPQQYARALYEATKGLKAKNMHVIVRQFANLLVKKRLLRRADEIIAEFIKFSKKQEGVVSLRITSARPLGSDIMSKVKKVFGDKVEAEENVDAGLLGGIMIRTEDKILDGSLKRQLVKLKQSLI